MSDEWSETSALFRGRVQGYTIGAIVTTICLTMVGWLFLHSNSAANTRAPEIVAPAATKESRSVCVIVNELDMMEGRTIDKFRPYFDAGLVSCIMLYRKDTDDYQVCFCEVTK